MTSFLTVEDVNGSIFSNQKFYWKEIDTGKISSSYDFTDVKYDFCKVSREYDSLNDVYLYSFEIDAENWTKGYYVLDNDGNYMNISGAISDGKLIFQSSETSIRLFLYMGNLSYDEITPFQWISKNEEVLLNYKEFKRQYVLVSVDSLSDDTKLNVRVSFTDVGYVQVKSVGYFNNAGFLLIKLVKSDFGFNCNQSLTVGKVNKVKLGTLADYKPNGDMIGEYAPKINVEYNREIIPVTWNSDLNDYTFDLDLTDKTNIGNVRFKVLIESNKVINASETTVILKSEYQSVSNFNDLKSACATGGIDIIQISGNITFSESIPVKHNIKIMGNNNTFDLDEHSIILDEDIQFNTEKILFNNGDTTIIQKNNSKVTLTDCTFSNCTSSEYNQLGSCIFCDTDISNLENPVDFETNLTNCTFIDNQNCIFHSGQLTVNNCKLHNIDIDYLNTNNVAFLYQTDGYANIRNSIFDIDYSTNSLCSNEINLGFAQAIIMCGETANINGATYSDLGNNDTLPFFDQTHNNQSHLFAKYYYPKAETCVYASPITNKENRCCCHAVSGVDWVFKNNIQITRASWNTQNTKRTIEWDNKRTPSIELNEPVFDSENNILSFDGILDIIEVEQVSILNAQNHTEDIVETNLNGEYTYEIHIDLSENRTYAIYAKFNGNEQFNPVMTNYVWVVLIYNGNITWWK